MSGVWRVPRRSQQP